MASDTEPAMPAAIVNSVESPTSHNDQVEQDGMPLRVPNEDGHPSLSGSQVDGMTDDPDKEFSDSPETTEVAKTQGLALLGAVLNDPDGNIAVEITKTKGFKAQVSSNDRCKTVRDLILGKKPVDDNSTSYVLATWCMLGGGIPAIWENPRSGNRGGKKQDPTDWGKQMLKELRQLRLGQTSGLEHCKDYAKGVPLPRAYNSSEAQKELAKSTSIPNAQTKKPKTNSKATPSSSRKSTAAKRKEKAEQNEGDETSDKGDTPATEPNDGSDPESDECSTLLDFTSERDTQVQEGEPDLSWRDEGPREVFLPLRPVRRSITWATFLALGQKLQAGDQDSSLKQMIVMWNDLVLVAHMLLDTDLESSHADLIERVVTDSSMKMPKAKPKDLRSIRWRAHYSTSFFEELTKSRNFGQCPFCPTEYRTPAIDDPARQDAQDRDAHDPQRFHDHQANLCHDTKEELQARRSLAEARLGARSETRNDQVFVKFTPLNDIYTKKILRSAHGVIHGIQRWNNQLHRLELTHKIVESADGGNIDQLRAEMLALRVCLHSNIVPPLVTEPTYILEKVRHEVNHLNLPKATPNRFAPSFIKYNCPRVLDHEHRHQPYDAGTWQGIVETHRQDKEDEKEVDVDDDDADDDADDDTSTTSQTSPLYVWNAAAPFSNPQYLHGRNRTTICFPVGCCKKTNRIVVVAYPPSLKQRLFYRTQWSHNYQRLWEEKEETIELSDIRFHNFFIGRRDTMLDDLATYIHHNNFRRLFEGLSWAEARFKCGPKAGDPGTNIPTPQRHNCGLRLDLDAVLSKEVTEDIDVPERLQNGPRSLDDSMDPYYDGSTMDDMVDNYKKMKAKGEWFGRSISRVGPNKIVEGAVFDDTNLNIRATLLGPVDWDKFWLRDGYNFLDFWTNGIKVKEELAMHSPTFPPLLISSIPVRDEQHHNVTGDSPIKVWIEHVKNAKMSANGAKPSFIPYKELPDEHIYSWPWVNPLGQSWLEQTFVAFFTAYGSVPSQTRGTHPRIKQTTTHRVKYYLTFVEPEERGRLPNYHREEICPLRKQTTELFLSEAGSGRPDPTPTTEAEAASKKPTEAAGAGVEAAPAKNGGDPAASGQPKAAVETASAKNGGDPAAKAQPEAASKKPTEAAGAAVETAPIKNGGAPANPTSNQASASGSRKRSGPTSTENDQRLSQSLDDRQRSKKRRLDQETGQPSPDVRASSVAIAPLGNSRGHSLPPVLPRTQVQSTTADSFTGDASLRQQLAALQQQVKDQDQQITAARQENMRLKSLGHPPQGNTAELLIGALNELSLEAQRYKRSLAVALEDNPEADVIMRRMDAMSDEISTQKKQILEHQHDKMLLENELDTTKDKLALVRSSLKAVKAKNSDLRSDARIRSKGIDKGLQALESDVKWQQEQMGMTQKWLQGTTVNTLVEYAQQLEQGNNATLSEIKAELVGAGTWPETRIPAPDNDFDFRSRSSGSSEPPAPSENEGQGEEDHEDPH